MCMLIMQTILMNYLNKVTNNTLNPNDFLMLM